jgi:hypothetical protein
VTTKDYSGEFFDEDFLDKNKQIGKNWKKYWKLRQNSPVLRREVRQEKAATKKRIHRKNRKNIRKYLNDINSEY